MVTTLEKAIKRTEPSSAKTAGADIIMSTENGLKRGRNSSDPLTELTASVPDAKRVQRVLSAIKPIDSALQGGKTIEAKPSATEQSGSGGSTPVV